MTAPRNLDATSSDFEYWAFISYSQLDVKWARWLQSQLETYKIPPGLRHPADGRTFPARLFPIFRDRDELPSAPDLAVRIRTALRQSRALIVICSPRSARSPWVDQEVREFKALGRADMIFPIIIDGEPNASDRPEAAAQECFPPAMRFAVSADRQLTEQRDEPIAADARPGKDGPRNAALKLIAGILDVGFDALRRRDALRQRRQRRIRTLAAIGAVLLMCLGYLSLADTELNVPGGAAIRRQCDRLGISLFRPVASDSVMARRASDARKLIRQRLIEAVRISDLDRTAWGMGQTLAAIYGDSETTPEELALLTPLIGGLFLDGYLVSRDGEPREWDDGYAHPRPEAPLWVMMALSAALGRANALSETERTEYLRYLDIAQQIADQFIRDDGGWNVLIEAHSKSPYVYSTAIALHALLDLQAAKLDWRGDPQKLQNMIHEAAGALQSAFRENQSVPGWGRTTDDDKVSDGNLTILVISALGRAHLEAAVAIPPAIEAAAIRHLIELYRRPYFPTNEDILYQSRPAKGQPSLAVSTRVMWYPWSNRALTTWLAYARQQQLPAEIIQALRRSQSHLLTELVTEMEREVGGAMLFVAAENGYGLQSSRGATLTEAPISSDR